MNFSQSKLKLKLKKPNNASTDYENKLQIPEISKSTKSENVSNDSVVSASDSFVEILRTTRFQSNDETTITKSPIFFKVSDCFLDQHVSNIVNKNKPCPICTQLVDVKNFLTHVKSCGTSHNIPSKILIKAVDLQERQDAEREALGLPIISKNLVKNKKPNANKKTKPKVENDSNLDLAIAMSVSLQESKEAEIIKESETLLEAGLEKEAIEKRKTLENFGFLSNQPANSKAKNFSKINSLLFKQTKEDREKRITEKVAMILLDTVTDESSELPSNCSNTKLKSSYLNKVRNVNSELWRKSLLEEDAYTFYVENLSKFIKPCHNDCNIGLKLVCPSPAELNTSTYESFTNNEEYDNTFHKIKKTLNNKIQNKIMSEYSSKWKSMLGNQFMSDITIYSRDELEIPVHSLVLYVQCPGILEDVITEELNSSKTKKMVMWLEYSYEACFSFLELIYSGQESFISPEYRDEYLNLSTRYNMVVATNDEDKLGWIPKDTLLKRKSPDISDFPADCKRYKASSPDMFSPDKSIKANSNFLEIDVNDEKLLSISKTEQWLEQCNRSQQNHISSFTKNLPIDISSQTVLIEKSPSHSFHSATTLCLELSPTSNYDDFNIGLDNHDAVRSSLLDNNSSSLKLLSRDKLNIKSALLDLKKKNMCHASTTHLEKNSTLTNTLNEPELIIIDSDSESVDMMVSNNFKKSCKNIINTSNKNDDLYLFQSIKKYKKNNFSCNSNNTKNKNYSNVIEINDNSSDSVHSLCSNMMLHTKNMNTHHLPSSSKNNKTIINIEDDHNVSSAVTKQTVLVQESSTKINPNCDTNSTSFSNNANLFKDENNSIFFQPYNGTNVKNNYLENNDEKSISRLETSLLSPTFSECNTNEATESRFSSLDYKNNSTLDKSVSVQVEPFELFDSSTSKKTTPIKDNFELDKSICEQIIDDPWMDYWQPPYVSPNHVSCNLSENNSLIFEDTSDVQTPNKNNICPINVDTHTPSIILNSSNKINSQNKNAVTPNKYGSRINTPKSLRRVQSESVIGSKEQISPLPDYSAMKTPDLRKEFDRYGLKDLGRRKGKLILRHIYDVLHPMISSEKALGTTEVEHYLSDSSNNSEHGIPDYEENYEELETLSQTNLSNKISVEMGFKQLLKVNEDLHNKILCYEPVWIEELKEYLKQYNVNISMQKLMTFLDDKCVTFRSKTLNDQRQKTLTKKNTKRKKLF